MISSINDVFFLRTEISHHLKSYIEWKCAKISTSAARSDESVLRSFFKYCAKRSLSALEVADVDAYRLHIVLTTGSHYTVRSTVRSINCFLRYCKARNLECIDPVTYSDDSLLSSSLIKYAESEMNKRKVIKKRVGRPSIDEEVIKKIQFLKDNTQFPLSFREIARVLQKDPAQVCRLYGRGEIPMHSGQIDGC